jgi:hypothetical protein
MELPSFRIAANFHYTIRLTYEFVCVCAAIVKSTAAAAAVASKEFRIVLDNIFICLSARAMHLLRSVSTHQPTLDTHILKTYIYISKHPEQFGAISEQQSEKKQKFK